jgi:hypothetical protein
MSNRLESHSHSSGSSRQQVAANLHKLGRIGFWIQFVLTIISVVILLFAIADPNLNLNLKSGLGLFSAIGGIAALGLSIYWFFRYTSLSKQLGVADPSLHPSRKKTIQVLQIGVFINLIGMLLTLLGIEVIVGVLLSKTLSFPEGAAIYRTGQLIEPLDIFVVQANVNLIVAQFIGIGIPAWLISRVEHH